MHPYLTKLDVREEVQLFFEPFYHGDTAGNLVFFYGDQTEHYGIAWHRVPRAIHWWQAGTEQQSYKRVFICASAMEAVAFLAINFHRFRAIDDLLFIALGTSPSPESFGLLRAQFKDKTISLVFGRDLLGRLMEIQLATAVRGYRLSFRYQRAERFEICYQDRVYVFSEGKLTLNAFEKASGLRCGIRTYKPKGFNTFLEQLTHQSLKQ